MHGTVYGTLNGEQLTVFLTGIVAVLASLSRRALKGLAGPVPEFGGAVVRLDTYLQARLVGPEDFPCRNIWERSRSSFCSEWR
jgi:hypothetical protein